MTWLPSNRHAPVLTVDKLCEESEAPDLEKYPPDYPNHEAPRFNNEDSIQCFRRYLVEKTEARRIRRTMQWIHESNTDALDEAKRHADLHQAWANSWFAHANAAHEREKLTYIQLYQHQWLNARSALLAEMETATEARMEEPSCSGPSSSTNPDHHLRF